MKRVIPVSVLALVLSLSVLQIAFAHAKIDHCTPATGATVAQAPGQVVCVMTEEIDTKLSTMSVWDASGNQVDKKDAHVDLNDPDHKTLLASLDPAAMNNGIYTVKYHTVTPDDNGITDGTFQFIVGSAAATPAPVTAVESGGAAPDASATPAALPQTGRSEANIGLIVSLLGLAVVGGGLAIRRFTR
jgi:LPXTG-motif cell wall-anchored protein